MTEKTGERNLSGLAPPWQPGESGNPGGRPRKILVVEYRKKLREVDPDDPEGRTFGAIVAAKTVQLAAKGDVAAIRELRESCDGKAHQSVEIGETRRPAIVSPEKLSEEQWSKRFDGAEPDEDEDDDENEEESQ